MADAEVTRKGHTITLGDDVVRIEEGPVRRTETATEELLHDDRTRAHYKAGPIEHIFNTPKGPITVNAPARDAVGNVIEIGKPITYLDYGGAAHPGSRCFYIYARRPIDPTKETFENGTRNPHYVPEHVREGALLADDGTPPNRTHYDHIFEEIDTVPIPDDPAKYEEAEQAAIARGQAIYADEIAKEGANA